MYERLSTDGSERFIVTMNVSEQPMDVVLPRAAAGHSWTSIFGEARTEETDGPMKVELPAYGYSIWRC